MENNQLTPDEGLVETLKRKSYTIPDPTNEDNGHYCININGIEADDVDNEEGIMYSNEEFLALYLQQNGYGDVKKAQIDILYKLIDEIPNYRTDLNKGVVEECIYELIKKLKG